MIKNNATVQVFFKLRNRGEMQLVARKLECDKKHQRLFLDMIESLVYCNKYGYLAIFMDESHKAKFRSNLLFEDGTAYETVHVR